MNRMKCHLGALLLLTGAACVGVDRDGSTEAASGLSPVQLADIPVPDGMTLLTGLNQSHSYEAGRFRVAELHYFGNPSIEEVASYLTARFPGHGWELVRDARDASGAELVFDRHPHQATCKLSRDGSVTRLRIDLRTPN